MHTRTQLNKVLHRLESSQIWSNSTVHVDGYSPVESSSPPRLVRQLAKPHEEGRLETDAVVRPVATGTQMAP